MNHVLAWFWLGLIIGLAATSGALTLTGGTNGRHAKAARWVDHALAAATAAAIIYLFAGGNP